MGMTLRAGKPAPYEVKKEVDNYENTSLFDNMFINGKSVGSRKHRRKRRRELAKQRKEMNKDSDMNKQAQLADNSGQIKQAALLKLATIKLAINWVLRSRQQN